MKDGKQYANPGLQEVKDYKNKFAWLPRLASRDKNMVVISSDAAVLTNEGKWLRKDLMVLVALIVIALFVFGINLVAFNPLQDKQQIDPRRATDADFLAATAEELCTLPDWRVDDYNRHIDSLRKESSFDKDDQEPIIYNPTWPIDRPVIDINDVVYVEKLTRDRVRAVFFNGSCEIYDFKIFLYNIQNNNTCEAFQPIPRDGQVTEYINLYYLEFFEKVKCESAERYRARLLVMNPECVTTRSIIDCGVGLFSVHVYRKLRGYMEAFNPHNDFKYRRSVKLEDCEC